jgi:hypothetical protein
MPLVVPDAGELELLDKMLKDALSVDESYILRLYKNNATPSQSTVIGDFTEADFVGYSPVTMSRAGWASSSTVSNKAQSTYAQQSWTCGSTGNTVYGYYVVGASSGVCLWAEKFGSARVMSSLDVLQLTPVFTLNSEN